MAVDSLVASTSEFQEKDSGWAIKIAIILKLL